MFWERFHSLCSEVGIKPNSIAMRDALGIKSTGTVTAWKSRKIVPDGHTLIKIAAYFNTSVDYLLGHSDDRHPPAPPGETKKAPVPEGTGAQYSEKVLNLAGLAVNLSEEAQDELIRLAELLLQQRGGQ